MPSSPSPRRVYRREWKPKTRSVRGSVSLPGLHLIAPTRPFFECPSCCFPNDRAPVCLWCKSTSPESAAAFWASMPKQRTVSAPMTITWCFRSVKSVKSAESVSRPRDRTPAARSVSSPASSLADKSNTFGFPSLRTSVTTAADRPCCPCPATDAAPPATQPEERKFHTLPLRRKGHILRTTAGMVVNKSRLSALFRKDAVPVLDKAIAHTHTHTHTPVAPSPHTRKSRPKAAADEGTRLRRQKPSTLPMIPDTPTVASGRTPAPHTPQPPAHPTPAPPSFLSPFWYRPEEYARLPASPPPRRGTSLDTDVRPSVRPTHAHTLSEPFPTLERAALGAPPQAWKRKMAGFFRHSVGVVAGHRAVA